MNPRLTIGDMAKLFHVSVSSLRHYEHLGLLKPDFIDPDSGYRYYSVRQFEPLNTIRYLRALNMPLPEIAAFLQKRDVGTMEQALLRQKQTVETQQQELARVERKIENRLRQLRDAQQTPLDDIQTVRLPKSRMLWLPGTLRVDGALDLEAPLRRLVQHQQEDMIFLGKVGIGISAEHLNAGCFTAYDAMFLLLDEEDRFEGPTRLLPETDAVRVRFRGSHPEAPAHYRRLMAYLETHGFLAAGDSREITLIDSGLTCDPQEFVTEISIPVRRA